MNPFQNPPPAPAVSRALRCRAPDPRRAICALFVTLAGAQAASAAPFGQDIETAWADTPRGRFTCRVDRSTGHRQVLTLAGRTIYDERTRDEPTIVENGRLDGGIRQENVGCPLILANERGYLVLERDAQPPHYGAQGYLVVNFNDPRLPVLDLGTGQWPQDGRIPDSRRLSWSDRRLTLRLVGYKPDEECCVQGAPSPRRLTVWYDFRSGTVGSAP